MQKSVKIFSSPNARVSLNYAATFQIMHLNEFLAKAASAPVAQTSTSAAQGAQQTPPPAWMQFAPIVLIAVVFYFLLIRPQSQRAKQQRKLVDALKSGDKVVTVSGIVGVVITVKDKTVSLRSADAKFEVTKSSVTEILESGGATES